MQSIRQLKNATIWSQFTYGTQADRVCSQAMLVCKAASHIRPWATSKQSVARPSDAQQALWVCPWHQGRASGVIHRIPRLRSDTALSQRLAER